MGWFFLKLVLLGYKCGFSDFYSYLGFLINNMFDEVFNNGYNSKLFWRVLVVDKIFICLKYKNFCIICKLS